MPVQTSEAKQRRNTRQRQLVLDAVRSRCDHPTADDIFMSVRAQDDHISRGTVYRNLNLLAQEGEIRSIHLRGGDRFDLRRDRHAHVVCRSCGSVADVPLPYEELMDERLAAQTGYVLVEHATTFEGLCPACQARL